MSMGRAREITDVLGVTTDTGREYVVDVFGCDAIALQDLSLLQSICAEVVADLDVKVIGAPHWHQFPGPSGVTGMYLLSESHLCCHTYPEIGFASFNLYCCGERREWPWEEKLSRRLNARSVTVRCLSRGTGE